MSETKHAMDLNPADCAERRGRAEDSSSRLLFATESVENEKQAKGENAQKIGGKGQKANRRNKRNRLTNSGHAAQPADSTFLRLCS